MRLFTVSAHHHVHIRSSAFQLATQHQVGPTTAMLKKRACDVWTIRVTPCMRPCSSPSSARLGEIPSPRPKPSQLRCTHQRSASRLSLRRGRQRTPLPILHPPGGRPNQPNCTARIEPIKSSQVKSSQVKSSQAELHREDRAHVSLVSQSGIGVCVLVGGVWPAGWVRLGGGNKERDW